MKLRKTEGKKLGDRNQQEHRTNSLTIFSENYKLFFVLSFFLRGHLSGERQNGPEALVLLLCQFSNGNNLFTFLKRDQPDALRRSSLNGDIRHFQTDDLSLA